MVFIFTGYALYDYCYCSYYCFDYNCDDDIILCILDTANRLNEMQQKIEQEQVKRKYILKFYQMVGLHYPLKRGTDCTHLSECYHGSNLVG